MRMDNWPMDRIMRLPDWCFGRRWPIAVYASGPLGDPAWDISELALPEKCVVWEMLSWHTIPWETGDFFRLALGNTLPTTIAEMDALSPLFHGLGIEGAEPRHITTTPYGDMVRFRMRMSIETDGRKLILEVDPVNQSTKDLQVVIVISAIPREVPDWLISAKAIDL